MGAEKPNKEDCQRMEYGGEAPESYDSTECQDCTYWDCIFMPEKACKEFMDGEQEAMFPEGIDDGFNFSDFGGE